MRLKDKIAFITGGNSGIGLASTHLFLAEGASIVATRLPGEALHESLAGLGDNYLSVEADVTNVGMIDAAVAKGAERFGRFDIVFANAGIVASTPLGGTSIELFDHILKVNVTGAFFTVQAALPHLPNGASIILMGSVTAVLGAEMLGAYSASKGAVRALSRVMATELSGRNIRVNTLMPGAAHTPIWNSLVDKPTDVPDLESKLAKLIPLGRFNTANEVAEAALFLASDASSSIHAAELVVDGGASGAPYGMPAVRSWLGG